ncbi:MAG: HAMP domain-containing histidine kinase [Tannerellaceae bacterium]|nr:HAMP domain-containing histidine kinase [Tannerellaceae bacterium]
MIKYITAGKISLIVLFAVGGVFLFMKDLYFSAGMLLVFLLLTAISLYYDQRKTIRKMEQMISHIHYGDLNISFHSKGKGAEAALSHAMNEALAAFRSRLYYSVVAETEVEAWQKLIRVLTHEIMNSMAPVISLSETVSERATVNGMNERDYEIMLQAMQTIHRRSKGLLEFVENYRKLTRIPMPVLSFFTVRSFFESLSALLPEEAAITYDIYPAGLQLKGDRGLLEQVVINLVKNAVEATPEGAKPAISLSACRKEGRVVISVTDKGTGIIPEALDKVFVPFYTTKSGGSGIGLSICRQIMNRHGGSISIQSKPDQGTTISLLFPPDRVRV